jgi:hypothetical protein
MSTSNPIKGQTVGAFAPDPAGTYPDDSTPGEFKEATIDPLGHLMGRDQILTDEGGFRDDFSGAALGADWSSDPGGGGSIVVAGSIVTLATALVPVAASRVYAARALDFLPFSISWFTTAMTPAGVAASTMQAFFGVYRDEFAIDGVTNPLRDPEHATAQLEFCEWRWLASDVATDFDAVCARDGATSTVASAVCVNRATTPNWRNFALDQEQIIYRDGSAGLGTTVAAGGNPPPTTRAVISLHLPDPFTPLFVAMGIRCGAAPGAVQGLVGFDAVNAKNINRLVVNTGF